MTIPVVADASIWVSIFVSADALHAVTRPWVQRHVMSGGRFIAPNLLLAEVAGAVSRRTGDAQLAHGAVAWLLNAPGLRFIILDRHLNRLAARLAADLLIRGTDATYVATARRLGVPLVTWDREQRERAGAVVTVLAPGEGGSAPRR